MKKVISAISLNNGIYAISFNCDGSFRIARTASIHEYNDAVAIMENKKTKMFHDADQLYKRLRSNIVGS